MKKLSFLAAALLMVRPQFAVEDSDAGAPVDPTTALTPAQAASEPVTVEVPAEHASIVERVVTLLREAESDITDNVKAGIEYLEQLWKDRNGG